MCSIHTTDVEKNAHVKKCKLGRTVQTSVVIIMEYCSKLMKVEVISCFWKKMFPFYEIEYG